MEKIKEIGKKVELFVKKHGTTIIVASAVVTCVAYNARHKRYLAKRLRADMWQQNEELKMCAQVVNKLIGEPLAVAIVAKVTEL